MNKAVVIGSSIQTYEGAFNYSQTRSIFNKEERLRQTIFTINSIQNSLPDSKIYLVDSSSDYHHFASYFSVFDNFVFVPLKELSYSSYELVNTHRHKSFCECLLLNTFYLNYKKELNAFDYVIKATGRYFYFNLNDSLFNEYNINKFMFKKPLQFKWNDSWNYQFVDRRNIQKDNLLKQYSTVLYSFGIEHLNSMIDINEASMSFFNSIEMNHYDIETLAYYLTRPFEDKILETDWKVSGWQGTSGQFMYY